MRPGKAIGGLAGLLLVAAAVVAAIAALVIIVMAAMAAIAAVAAALVAYFKRETWTLPAYRWARDQTGKRGFVPWSTGGGGSGNETPTTDEPAAAE
jgi:hypothetical protein